MNNILLICFTAFSLILTSCSSDDSSDTNVQGSSKVTLTIDGVQKTFNVINVNVIAQYENNRTVQITASIDNNPSEIITFTSEKWNVGTTGISGFTIIKNDVPYNSYGNSDDGTFFNNI